MKWCAIERAGVLECVLGDRPLASSDVRRDGDLDAGRWQFSQMNGREGVEDLTLAGAHGDVGEAADLLAGCLARHDGHGIHVGASSDDHAWWGVRAGT